jgi:uncharacterized protein YoaH (UPF0181 family)
MTSEASGNAEIQETPEDVQELDKPQKVSKIEQKRQQIMAERIQRKTANGMSLENAVAAIKREDFEALPLGERQKRLESAMIGNFRKVAQDMGALNDNQTQLADIMDVNFRAFEKMLTKLGIPPQEQLDTMTLVVEEIKAERDARAAAATTAQEEAKKEDLLQTVDEAGIPDLPVGATVFGN